MKYRHLSISLWLMLLVSIIACGTPEKQAIEQIIDNTQNHFAPDSRVALFDVKTSAKNDGWILKGETNLPDAKAALLDSLSIFDGSVTDSITVLPEAALDGKTYGIINNSVANIRSRPSHPAQLVTQATLGMPVKVLKKRSNWYLIQTPDDYLGWIDSGGLETMTEDKYRDWSSESKIIYLDTYGFVYENPGKDSPKVSDLVSGSILNISGTEGNFYKVRYPDGRNGYISQAESRDFDSWKASVEASQEQLVQTAKSMMGAPYLWGGTSAKGMDCSGYTKTIYYMSGWIIPRDASQQIHAGQPLDTSEDFENLQTGDLLFFGRPATESAAQRVVHVGMWIGNNEFIHSAGRVKISSVDPDAENYDEYNLNRFLEAKRYLNNKEGNIINVEDMFKI